MSKRLIILIVFLIGLTACQLKDLNQIIKNESTTEPEQEEIKRLNIDVLDLMGKSVEEATEHFGEPHEKGQSIFNYEWLVYNSTAQYLQVGHEEGKIVTIFILGDQIIKGPLQIRSQYNDIKEHVLIKNEITVHHNHGEYKFVLTEEDMREHPLVQLTADTYAQLYFDRYTAELVAIRLLNKDILLAHRPYRIVYKGPLNTNQAINSELQKEAEKANVKQIFSITNVLRERYEKQKLDWHEKVANTAYHHSKDMKENGYFDHYSEKHGDLKNRLTKNEIKYFLAGENIAAEYPDGIAAVMGWLNSEGHRETMFHEDFTHLGVGVYDKHYTQNYIAK